MGEEQGCAPPVHPGAAAAARLRAVFARAGYTEEGLRAACGQSEETPDGRPNVAYYERRLAEPTPLHTLVRLFVVGAAVPVEAARAAFGSSALDDALAGGLVRAAEGTVRTAFAVSTAGGLLLVHDPSGASFAGLHPEHVAGVGAASLQLAGLTPRQPVARALDVGAGCGVHALLAARHSDHVVAVDVNPRALGFTTFNAHLNELDVEVRQGDWFAPVGDERFDLVVCNPPFVISPDEDYTFRDGALAEDALSATIVRDAAAHLADGGVAAVFCNWGHRDDGEWWEPAARWVEGLGCDAWLHHDGTVDPLRYAATWNRGLRGTAYGDALDRWTTYLADAGIRAITTGAVLLRRRDGQEPWLRVAGGGLGAPTGEQVERIFAAEDLLAGGDDAVRGARLRLPDDHRLEFDMRAADGRVAATAARLRLEGGLCAQVEVDEDVLFVLARCDGGATVEEVAVALAAARDRDPAEVRAGVVGAARRLLTLGLATPATG